MNTPLKTAAVVLAPIFATIFSINYTVVSVVRITGNDLAPDFRQGDLAVASRMAYGNLTRGRPQRGDAVWIKNLGTGQYGFSRILAIPGDWIEVREARLFINGKPNSKSLQSLTEPLSLTLEPDRFFSSSGLLTLKEIKAKVIKNLSR